MADFLAYAPRLRDAEGGFINDKYDRGGATNMGVTLRTYSDFRKCQGYNATTIDDLKKMTIGEWTQIMKRYWDRWMADEIENQSLAELLVDWCVNSGSISIKRVQALLSVAIDGIVGVNTLSAINSANQRNLFFQVKQARLNFYQDIVRKDPTQKKFLIGWENRLKKFNFYE